jgi:uncharacterized membrane protein (DUF2068 family)
VRALKDHTLPDSSPHRDRAGLRMVAVFEAIKGILVLVTGFGLLAFLRVDLERAAEYVVHHLRMDPGSRVPSVFLQLVHNATDLDLWILASIAAVYATVRLVEAWGLWNDAVWASWLGALSGSIYLPFELFEVLQKCTFTRVSILASNLLIVIFLAYRLWLRHRAGADIELRDIGLEPVKATQVSSAPSMAHDMRDSG